MNKLIKVSAVVLALGLSASAEAATVFSNIAGAVVNARRSAHFDSVLSGSLIHVYEEEGIALSFSGGPAFVNFAPAPAGFSGGFYYAGNADSNAFRIALADSSRMAGIQFNVGTGFTSQTGGMVRVVWELVRDAVAVASGVAEVDTSSGGTLGFRDDLGFDSLRIANYGSNVSSFQATGNGLAIDELIVDTDLASGPAPVPEPSSMLLIGATAVLFRFYRRTA